MRRENMEGFQSVAEKMVTAMESHARKLGVTGVALVARMNDSGFAWTSQMKAVGRIISGPETKDGKDRPGNNYIGIAYTKAAEMAETKIHSGTTSRQPLHGEFGYPGGAIEKLESGYILAVFSGATGEQDFEISQVGIKAYHEA
ncbi:MAG: hypothetical protein E4H09_04620 [Spirochaetales bacterium]|nr:MAG: hypothetical protein E4H09_04620 [Spirochaetales bacterium]